MVVGRAFMARFQSTPNGDADYLSLHQFFYNTKVEGVIKFNAYISLSPSQRQNVNVRAPSDQGPSCGMRSIPSGFSGKGRHWDCMHNSRRRCGNGAFGFNVQDN